MSLNMPKIHEPNARYKELLKLANAVCSSALARRLEAVSPTGRVRRGSRTCTACGAHCEPEKPCVQPVPLCLLLKFLLQQRAFARGHKASLSRQRHTLSSPIRAGGNGAHAAAMRD